MNGGEKKRDRSLFILQTASTMMASERAMRFGVLQDENTWLLHPENPAGKPLAVVPYCDEREL
jgi:hypothetical protein